MKRRRLLHHFTKVVLLPVAALLCKGQNTQQPRAAVVYEMWFRFTAASRQKYDDHLSRGKGASAVRDVPRDKLQLTQAQANIVEAVAVDCVKDLEQIDKRAATILSQRRADRKNGKAAMSRLVPPELARLQSEREDLVLTATKKLRQSLGETAFQVLDKRLASLMTPGAVTTPRAN